VRGTNGKKEGGRGIRMRNKRREGSGREGTRDETVGLGSEMVGRGGEEKRGGGRGVWRNEKKGHSRGKRRAGEGESWLEKGGDRGEGNGG